MKKFISRLSVLAIMSSFIVVSFSNTAFAAHTIDVMVDDGEAITITADNKVIGVDTAAANCDTVVAATLTEGVYTPTELAAEIKSKIDAALVGTNISSGYDYETRTFTFVGNVDGDSICWSHATTTAEVSLGFAAVDDLDIDTTPAVSDTAQSIGDRAYLTSSVGSTSTIMDIQVNVAGGGDSVDIVTIIPPTGYNITGWNLFNADDGTDTADATDTPNMDNNAGNTTGCGDVNSATVDIASITNCVAEITGNGSNSLALDLQAVVTSGQTLVVQLYVDVATTAAQSGNWTVTTTDNNGAPASVSETFQVVTADAGDVVFEVYPAGDALDGDVSQGLTTNAYIYDPDGTNFAIGASAWATTKKTLVSGMALYQDGTEFTSPGGANGTFDYAVTGTDERLVASDATYDFDGITIIKAARTADATDPDINAMTVDVSGNQNIATFTLTEPLINDTLTIDANHSITSTATIGDFSSNTGLVIAGIGKWTDADAQPNTTNATGCNTVAIDDTLTVITITANGTSGCFFSNALASVAANAANDDFTPAGTFIADAAANTTDTTAIGTGAITVTSGWDVTPPTQIANFKYVSVGGGVESLNIQWGAHATLADFSRYMFAYGTNSGVGLSSSLWTSSNDANLTTISQTNSEVTGLTTNSTYHLKAYAVDIAGNVSTASSEISALIAGQSASSNDTTAPGVPTGFTITLNAELQPVLTWTAPTDADLDTIQISRSTGPDNDPSSELVKVDKLITSYTDDFVFDLGTTVNYKIRAYDKSGNGGAFADVASVLIEEPASEPAAVAPVSVTLAIQNASGQAGTATLTEADGKTTVTIATTGGPTDVDQPAHIHMGSCSALGDAKYTLTSVSNNASVTVLDMTIEALKAGLPLAINIHKSAEESTVFYACGDILAAAVEEVAEEADEEAVTEEEAGEPTPVAPASGVFGDTTNHWAKTEIAAMTVAGVIKGNPDGTFKPDNNINRAEVAILLCRIAGNDDETATSNPFSDVKSGAWYGGCVSALKTMGITKGNPDGTYKPTSDINRAEFLTLAMRLYEELVGGVTAETTTTAYTDLKTDWYTGTVATATKLGFVNGSTCGTGKCFYAEKPISRAEASTILYRMFKAYLEM